MNLKHLSAGDLKKIGELLKQRASLMASVEKIDRQLESYEGGIGSGGTTPASAVPRKRRKLKEAVLALLRKAGKEGATVKDIASKLGVDPNRIYTWFYSTGSRMDEIKKIGEARYTWAS